MWRGTAVCPLLLKIDKNPLLAGLTSSSVIIGTWSSLKGDPPYKSNLWSFSLVAVSNWSSFANAYATATCLDGSLISIDTSSMINLQFLVVSDLSKNDLLASERTCQF